MSSLVRSVKEAKELLGGKLKQRRFEMLPIDGAATAPTTGVQGRQPGVSTAPTDLVELISSIASVGLLQPILVEDIDGHHRVVAGERRLRAMRWGRTHLPDNPHFLTAAAVVVPGPLDEAQRRSWQLVENLAREDLQPAELGAALVLERVAVLAERLTEAGHVIPDEVWIAEDPVRRWELLDKYRTHVGEHSLGAPWDETLGRVGVQLSMDKARQVVRAFSTLPREISAEMDEAKVALATRLEYLRLDRGRRDAAEAIWAAVKARKNPRLLLGALRASEADSSLSAADAVEFADASQRAADRARQVANQTPAVAGEGDGLGVVDETTTQACEDAMAVLLRELRSGKRVQGYLAGTIVLHARELIARLT